VEVAADHHLAVIRDHRVVDHRAQLGLQHPAGEAEHVTHGPVDLRRAPQAVGVLHRVPAGAVAGHQRRARQQSAQVGGADQLARVRPERLHALVVRPVVAEQRLHRHRAGDVGRLDQHRGLMYREREQDLHRFGPVDQRQPFLGREPQRLDPVLAQHLRGRPAIGTVARPTQPALADQRLGQVRELGQVAGCPHRALARNDRKQAELEQLQQALREYRADSGVAGRERPGP